VLVDPLDGTKEFLKGNLSAVTVLIGLSIKGIPKVGIVHNPFSTNDPKSNGMTIFGT
jgi:3'-phosphoadenosine 5'-phosphosulfate (PAPS) 3'-phosphatase